MDREEQRVRFLSLLRPIEGDLENYSRRNQVANEVIVNHARVQSLADQMAMAKRSLSDAAEALRLGQERKEFGVGVVLETILAQQELSRVRNDYLNIVTDYNKTQYALLRALGRLAAPTTLGKNRDR